MKEWLERVVVLMRRIVKRLKFNSGQKNGWDRQGPIGISRKIDNMSKYLEVRVKNKGQRRLVIRQAGKQQV